MNNTTGTFNDTYLVDDPFDDQEHPEPFDLEAFVRYSFVTTKVLSDIVILYSIKKFQVLKTWENSLVMHSAIVDLLYIVLFQLLYSNTMIDVHLLCFFNTLMKTLFISTKIFAEGILLGFVLLNCKCSLLQNHENNFKRFYVLGLYVFCSVEAFVEFMTCRHWFDIFLLTSHTLLIMSIIINVFLKKLIKFDGHASQTYYVVYISNIAVFSLIPIFVYHYLLRYFRGNEGLTKFLEATALIGYLVMLSDSTIILYILYKYCREFRTALILMFKKLVMRSGVSWSELQEV